jgi:hypothetical protein
MNPTPHNPNLFDPPTFRGCPPICIAPVAFVEANCPSFSIVSFDVCPTCQKIHVESSPAPPSGASSGSSSRNLTAKNAHLVKRLQEMYADSQARGIPFNIAHIVRG